MTNGRRLASLGLRAAMLAAVCASCSGGAPDPATPPQPQQSPGTPPVSADPVNDRLVVLHVPGVDPDLVERWRGDLPALDRLSLGRPLSRVDFDPPGTWEEVGAQAATGRRGGAAGPLGGARLDRTTGTLRPARLADWSRAAPSYWERAARAGVPTRALWMPGPLPAEETPGLWAVAAELPASEPRGGVCVAVNGATPPVAPELALSTAVEGPGPWTVELALGDAATWRIDIEERGPETWRLTFGGVRADISVGEISAPFDVALPDALGGAPVTVRVAATRQGPGALLSVLEAGVGVGGGEPRTVPASFETEWRRFHGELDSSGGAHAALRALSAGLIGPGQLVDVAEQELAERGQALVEELRRRDARLVVADLPEAGLVTQGLFGLSDARHPYWTPELASLYGASPKALYVRLDDVISKVQRSLQADDRLVVVSDHGVHSAHALVDLNAELAALGRIELGPADGPVPPLLGEDLPWSRVRAWSTGPGYIYVDAEGRGPGGSVEVERVPAEVESIRAALTALEHEGDPVVAEVLDGAAAFPALDADRRPDLVVRFNAGFDISPVSFHGGVGRRVVAPNRGPMTAGLGAAAVELQGFAVTSFGTVPTDAHIADLAPTVLSLLGLPPVAELDGHTWDIARRRPAAASDDR